MRKREGEMRKREREGGRDERRIVRKQISKGYIDAKL